MVFITYLPPADGFGKALDEAMAEFSEDEAEE